jgi:hypothetical protein
MDSRITHRIALFVFLAGGFILQLIPCQVHGQSPANIMQNDQAHLLSFYDVNGHPIVNPAAETEGTPLFVSKWNLGWIRLADGRSFVGVPLELDLEKQTVHYRRSDGIEIEVEPGQVRQLAMVDTIAGKAVAFQFACGFDPIDNQSETSFYLLLDSGKVCFLESMRKKVYKEEDGFSAGNTRRQYKLYDEFYVYNGGKMTRIKKDNKFFLELTNNKHDQMDDYLKKNKISFRSMEDIRQFIDYYNGLP